MSSLTLQNALKFMKQQVPALSLLLQSQCVKYISQDCSDSSVNAWALTTFIMISLFTIGWTIYHSIQKFNDQYGRKHNNEWVYVLLQTVSSYLAYISLSYYVFDGRPYNCAFVFSQTLAGILFWFSLAAIIVIATVEHHVWAKVAALPPFGF